MAAVSPCLALFTNSIQMQNFLLPCRGMRRCSFHFFSMRCQRRWRVSHQNAPITFKRTPRPTDTASLRSAKAVIDTPKPAAIPEVMSVIVDIITQIDVYSHIDTGRLNAGKKCSDGMPNHLRSRHNVIRAGTSCSKELQAGMPLGKLIGRLSPSSRNIIQLSGKGIEGFIKTVAPCSAYLQLLRGAGTGMSVSIVQRPSTTSLIDDKKRTKTLAEFDGQTYIEIDRQRVIPPGVKAPSNIAFCPAAALELCKFLHQFLTTDKYYSMKQLHHALYYPLAVDMRKFSGDEQVTSSEVATPSIEQFENFFGKNLLYFWVMDAQFHRGATENSSFINHSDPRMIKNQAHDNCATNSEIAHYFHTTDIPLVHSPNPSPLVVSDRNRNYTPTKYVCLRAAAHGSNPPPFRVYDAKKKLEVINEGNVVIQNSYEDFIQEILNGFQYNWGEKSRVPTGQDVAEMMQFVGFKWEDIQREFIPRATRKKIIRVGSTLKWFAQQPRYFEVRFKAGRCDVRRSPLLNPAKYGMTRQEALLRLKARIDEDKANQGPLVLRQARDFVAAHETIYARGSVQNDADVASARTDVPLYMIARAIDHVCGGVALQEKNSDEDDLSNEFRHHAGKYAGGLPYYVTKEVIQARLPQNKQKMGAEVMMNAFQHTEHSTALYLEVHNYVHNKQKTVGTAKNIYFFCSKYARKACQQGEVVESYFLDEFKKFDWQQCNTQAPRYTLDVLLAVMDCVCGDWDRTDFIYSRILRLNFDGECQGNTTLMMEKQRAFAREIIEGSSSVPNERQVINSFRDLTYQVFLSILKAHPGIFEITVMDKTLTGAEVLYCRRYWQVDSKLLTSRTAGGYDNPYLLSRSFSGAPGQHVCEQACIPSPACFSLIHILLLMGARTQQGSNRVPVAVSAVEAQYSAAIRQKGASFLSECISQHNDLLEWSAADGMICLRQ